MILNLVEVVGVPIENLSDYGIAGIALLGCAGAISWMAKTGRSDTIRQIENARRDALEERMRWENRLKEVEERLDKTWDAYLDYTQAAEQRQGQNARDNAVFTAAQTEVLQRQSEAILAVGNGQAKLVEHMEQNHAALERRMERFEVDADRRHEAIISQLNRKGGAA